jgi:glutaminyl-tRNA synthetase
MYDWAHGLEDSIEGITHSLCTLEFEIHRPLYDWFIDAINKGRGNDAGRAPSRGPKIHHPQQIEFARLNPTYMVTIKRTLKQLVDDGTSPAGTTRGCPRSAGSGGAATRPSRPAASAIGVGTTKFNASHDIGKLETRSARISTGAPRVAWPCCARSRSPSPTGASTATKAASSGSAGGHQQPGRRLAPAHDRSRSGASSTSSATTSWKTRPRSSSASAPAGGPPAVGVLDHLPRLREGRRGEVIELLCTYDPETRGGDNPPPDAEGKVRKVKGTLHWVSATDCLTAEVRLFDRLYNAERARQEDRRPPRRPEPRFARSHHRRAPRKGPRPTHRRRARVARWHPPLPVRTHRLLLYRPRGQRGGQHGERRTGLQPHGVTQRQLGERVRQRLSHCWARWALTRRDRTRCASCPRSCGARSRPVRAGR